MHTIQGAQPERVSALRILGEPRSKQRPRFANGRAYTPKETLDAERKIADAWRALEHDRFEHQVILEVSFFNETRRRKDLDNMVKLVLDALNKLAFEDDAQVVEILARKFFCEKGKARTEIVLREIILWPYE